MGIRFFILTALTFVSATSHAALDFSKAAPLAYVYHGAGVCRGCPESLKTNIIKAGYRVEWITPGMITPQNLSRAALFAVPGGEEERDVKRALQEGESQNIQRFVAGGGKYLGVCLGAYLAPKWLPDAENEPGLALFHGKVKNHSPTKEARMELILWRGKNRWMYFQDGPEFKIPKIPHSEVWARYRDGSIAALQAPYGKGKIGLIGTHPEADQVWLDDDHLEDPDGNDSDLLVDFLDGLEQKPRRGHYF